MIGAPWPRKPQPRRRLVSGAVVDDHNLRGGQCLAQHAIECGAQQFRPVVSGYDNTDRGFKHSQPV